MVGLTTREPDGKLAIPGTLLIDNHWSVVKAQELEHISAELSRLLKSREQAETIALDRKVFRIV